MDTSAETLDDIISKWTVPKNDWTKSRFEDRCEQINGILDDAENPPFHTLRYKLKIELKRITCILEAAGTIEVDVNAPLLSQLPRKKPVSSEPPKRIKSRVKKRQNDFFICKKECLRCRKFGHTMRDCPESRAPRAKCWRCGQSDHALNDCPDSNQESGSNMPLPYAVCFVCKETGHIASQCELNPNGIYPKGGSCFYCGSVRHLAANCEMRREKLAQKRLNRSNKRHSGMQVRNVRW